MRRRRYLATAASTIVPLSGCLSGSDGDGASGGATPSGNADSTPTTSTSETTRAPGSGSQLQGPTTEDPTQIDVQYRNYTTSEVSEIKARAETVEYGTLRENVDSYVGRAVQYRAVVSQVVDNDGYRVLLLAINNAPNQVAFGSWTGRQFRRTDVIEFYAEVLGTETYRTASVGEMTVPALTIADAQLRGTPTG
jgi:hypothetical protein